MDDEKVSEDAAAAPQQHSDDRGGAASSIPAEKRDAPITLPPGARLTEKQRAFCVEVYKGADTATAYSTAYPRCRDRRTARQEGRKLLLLPHIGEFLAALRNQAIDYANVSRALTEREIARIGFSDIRKLFDPDTGEVLPVDKWPDDVAPAVSSYSEEVAPGGMVLRRRIKLWDKPGALKLLTEIKGFVKPPATPAARASFTFNFGSARGRGRAAGRVIEATPAAPKVDND